MRKVVIQNHSEEAAIFKSRSAFLFVCIMMAFLILLGNLYHLQVVSFSDYQMRSNENRTRMRAIAPNRGLIYDRNGVLIAENRPFFSLEMIPEKVKDAKATLAELAKLFNLSDAQQATLLNEIKRHKSFRPFTILEQLDETQVAKFSVVKYKFEGVYVYAGLKRHYPHGNYLTHVLGYVGRINVQDQNRLEKENRLETYAATHNIGKLGIEAYYEELLHGLPGRIQEEVNNHGRSIQVLQEKAPQSGLNLHLTIDLALQKKAMDLLGGRKGAVVALEPTSGEILALVSSPSYDPNLFIHGINDVSYKHLINSKDKPLINRATQGTYAPASTIKAHLVLAGLNYQIITASSKVWDPGWWQVPGVSRKFRDWKKWGHGWIDLHNAVAKSCDVFFYDLAYKMGIDKISTSMAKFGFGQKTGIDINEERSGILPSREWKKAKRNEPWYVGDSISIGIGQGYWTTTPIQLAQSIAILATKGTRHQPHLLKATSDNGSIQTQKQYTEIEPVKLTNEAYWNIANKSMYYAARINQHFKNAPYQAAVKSGTAQIFSVAEDEEYDSKNISEHLRDNALFVGWAPYKNPQIAVVVILENAGWGSINAAPVVRALFDAYLLSTKAKI